MGIGRRLPRRSRSDVTPLRRTAGRGGTAGDDVGCERDLRQPRDEAEDEPTDDQQDRVRDPDPSGKRTQCRNR